MDAENTETAVAKSEWNWWAFFFNAAYYAGYGQMKKAFIFLAVSVLLGTVLSTVLAVVTGVAALSNLSLVVMIAIMVYAAKNANTDLPVKQVEFNWKNVVIYIVAGIVVSFVIGFILGFLLVGGAVMSAAGDLAQYQ